MEFRSIEMAVEKAYLKEVDDLRGFVLLFRENCSI